MTRILTSWSWTADPEAPLRWPDPERRVVLVEPDLFEGALDARQVHASRIVAQVEGRCAVFVEPTRTPDQLGRTGRILDGIVPALLARTQADLDAGLPDLLAVRGAHRALLLEPTETMSLPLNISDCILDADGHCIGEAVIDWVLVRGTDQPLHPGWVRSIRDECAAAGVPFAFLSWGSWIPTDRQSSDGVPTGWVRAHNRIGCRLDGREHMDSPWGPLGVDDGGGP